ncbi:ATP-binding protein [Lacrimispora defluvii]|uniref:histidine kinase n=1 Tax=Lacrimispora defluvii TaxID=2719233 RepID=A0ABX1W2T6_9FIRM|nr:PAS domain-containing hybrid sensor histidine kinase/response regulator [Lacrimispora defluvii]NNJ32813.1 PAS domain-containing protein [Lacrimispora defluvii]
MLEAMQKADRIQFLEAMLSSMGDGVIATGRDGSVLYINPLAEKLTGWSNEEAEGMPLDKILPLVNYFSGERLNSPVREALEAGKPVGLQNHAALVTRGGKTLFISASSSPIYTRGDQAEGVVVVLRDIDRIKSIEEETREEKDNLKKVLEALPTGIMLVGDDTVVNWANKPLQELFRVCESDMIGRRFGDASHCIYSYESGGGRGGRCHLCEIRQNISKVIRDGTPCNNVILQRSFLNGDDENSRWLNISFIPLAAMGEAQVLVAVEDVTQQKNYETALQRSRDEAESANRIKSEFIANMSHEIRTPLNGLIGMMDLLLQSGLSTEQTEYIGMAKMSADALLKVIGNILDFSRIESGAVTLANMSFDIKALTDEIINIYEVLAEKKGLELHYDFSSDIPRYLIGDPDRLRQVLGNLIGNAIKFTDAGVVSVAVRNVAAAEKSVSLEFHISDTGIGISTEKMDLLFKRFSQVDGSVTRRHSGSGLGLAICKQLVELMGGSIHVESAIGTGSTFRFAIDFALNGEAPLHAVHGTVLEVKQALPSIVTDSSELRKHISGKADRIVILDHHADPGECNRVRIGENGEITLGNAAVSTAEEDRSDELDKLFRLLRKLKAIVLEKQINLIEETAHSTKQTALRIGANELADLAFRAELSSRKQNWDDALEYCEMMINEINFRYKEG